MRVAGCAVSGKGLQCEWQKDKGLRGDGTRDKGFGVRGAGSRCGVRGAGSLCGVRGQG